MTVLFYLMVGYALLGSVDIGYFHLFRCRLYRSASSRLEQGTHFVREILFLAAFFWVMFVKAQGVYALILPVLLLVDFVNSLVDVLLEPKSRVSLGGLPPGEYFIHMLTMFLNGAVMAVAFLESAKAMHEEPQLIFRTLEVPFPALVVGGQILVGTAVLFLVELILRIRFRRAE